MIPKRLPRPTLQPKSYRVGGITWVPDLTDNPQWYYHNAEGEVFPYSAYQKLHRGHAVLPVRPA